MSQDLTPTAWTALGFITMRPRTGYEINQAAQGAISMVWGISYGQLYPQLRHLHEQGLIEPAGPVAERNRTTWQATAEGRRALRDWLRQPAAPPHLRDETLVKLLFADALAPAEMVEIIRARREEFAALLARLEATVPGANWPDPSQAANLTAVRLLRDYGLAQARAGLAWADRAERELAVRRPPEGTPDPRD